MADVPWLGTGGGVSGRLARWRRVGGDDLACGEWRSKRSIARAHPVTSGVRGDRGGGGAERCDGEDGKGGR